jgi:hypothetical protein
MHGSAAGMPGRLRGPKARATVPQPDGTGPEPVNGFGGGPFVVPDTSFTVTLGPSVAPGTYQIRVIGLFASANPSVSSAMR